MFGNNLDAYGIIQAVLECGILPYKVLLARPDNADSVCSDRLVVERLDAGLKDAGIKVWNNLSLVGWVVDEGGKLAGVRLKSPGGDYEIQCQGFIYVDKKGVDMQAFKGT